jgi:hypothetical protein
MQTIIDPDLLDRLRVGPLASCLDSYLKRIELEGFSPSSVPMQMYAIGRFSNWLLRMQLDLHQVDEDTIDRFLHRDPNIVHCAESASLRRLLALLRDSGVTASKPPECKNCRQRFIDEYRSYLRQERGLAELPDLLQGLVTCLKCSCIQLILFGSSGRTRTYNPSVNSRMAHHRLALQIKHLHALNWDFPRELGGLWGGSRECQPGG